MNAMCTFVYLFVEYFSFAPVISASIHRYVNYYDIQVLMIVTETKMLTSTLHLNKFTCLNYVFLLPLYIYIYIRWIKEVRQKGIFFSTSFSIKFGLLNSIWNFMSYLMPKSAFKKNSSINSWVVKGVQCLSHGY